MDVVISATTNDYGIFANCIMFIYIRCSFSVALFRTTQSSLPWSLLLLQSQLFIVSSERIPQHISI